MTIIVTESNHKPVPWEGKSFYTARFIAVNIFFTRCHACNAPYKGTFQKVQNSWLTIPLWYLFPKSKVYWFCIFSFTAYIQIFIINYNYSNTSIIIFFQPNDEWNDNLFSCNNLITSFLIYLPTHGNKRRFKEEVIDGYVMWILLALWKSLNCFFSFEGWNKTGERTL